MKKLYIKVGYKTAWEDEFVACIGFFDGLHKGHRALVDKTIAVAKDLSKKSAIITFDPDPSDLIKGTANNHLTTIDDRVELANKLGIDYFIILTFNNELRSLDYKVFISDILNKMPLNTLVCGFDFRFGYKAQGNINELKSSLANFNVEVIEKITTNSNDNKVSSSSIIKLIKDGDVSKANSLLGYEYSLSGVVNAGRKEGNKLGYPTANIDFIPEYVIPLEGVYLGYLLVDDVRRPSMISVGHNPTFNYRNNISIEVFVLNFNNYLYGRSVRVIFTEFLRHQIKFDDVSGLIKQLKIDEENAQAYFNGGNNEIKNV